MKVYIATSGKGEDRKIHAAFANFGDADAYSLGDAVVELEVHDAPVEARQRHILIWTPTRPDSRLNPFVFSQLEDFHPDGVMTPSVRWLGDPADAKALLEVEAWTEGEARVTYMQERATYEAEKKAMK